MWQRIQWQLEGLRHLQTLNYPPPTDRQTGWAYVGTTEAEKTQPPQLEVEVGYIAQPYDYLFPAQNITAQVAYVTSLT